MEQTKPSQSLPDNAYRELKPGEEYVPMMPADAKPKEVTPYSVTMGLLMTVLFSAAAAYLGLRIGQVFEAAIPIAIIAVGVGNMLGKKNMLGQNVIIQSIGASSGIIVAGAIFTLPALYILGLETAFYKVCLLYTSFKIVVRQRSLSQRTHGSMADAFLIKRVVDAESGEGGIERIDMHLSLIHI